MTVGDRIKSLREREKLTQDELGEILGVKRSAIAKYEAGRVVNFKRDTIDKICNHFGVTVSWLMYGVDATTAEGLNTMLEQIVQQYETEWSKLEAEMLADYRKLNTLGKEEANKRIKEMLEITRYTEGKTYGL